MLDFSCNVTNLFRHKCFGTFLGRSLVEIWQQFNHEYNTRTSKLHKEGDESHDQGVTFGLVNHVSLQAKGVIRVVLPEVVDNHTTGASCHLCLYL